MTLLQPSISGASDLPAAEDWFPLEAELKADERGERRDALLNNLRQRSLDIKHKLDEGAPPAEFQSLERLHKGLESAAQVVDLVWNIHHKTPPTLSGA